MLPKTKSVAKSQFCSLFVPQLGIGLLKCPTGKRFGKRAIFSIVK